VTTANPLSVSVTLDTSHAVTQTMTSSGGSLTATGADGSSYTLTLPSGALSDTTAITVTPIQSLQPLPPGATLAGGVDLAPDGLQLIKPGTLVMKLAHSPAVQNQLGTSYSASGQDFHLTPLTTDATTITFPIIHFSGRPMLDGRPAVSNYMYQHPPSSIPARYEQLMAGDVSLLRSGTITQAEYIDRAIEVYRRLYNEVALKDAQAGLTDDAALALAFADWLYMARSLGIYGLESRLATELQNLFGLVRQGMLNSIDRAGHRCAAAPHNLVYDSLTGIGWTIDLVDHRSLLKTVRQGAIFMSIPVDDPHVLHAIGLCRPRGFTFDIQMPAQLCGLTGGCNTLVWEWKARVCGDDPRVGQWTVKRTVAVDGVVHDTRSLSFALDEAMSISGADAVPVFVNTLLGELFFTEGSATLKILTPDPQVQLHRQLGGLYAKYLSPTDQTATAPVVEDATCPPLQPS
jgi:hypothetical protein